MAAPSTTDLVPIKDIRDGIALLRDGSVRGIVEISAINFDLRSSEEQAAILEQFQAFLNTIDFPLQMLVHSRRFDITTYLAGVEESAAQLSNELLKLQSQEYVRFVRELSDLANIMSKRFYVTVPLTVVAQKKEAKGILGSFKGMFKKRPAAPAVIPEEQYAQWRSQVIQRADIVISGLAGMGLKGKLLEQDRAVSLFTDLYHPNIPGTPAAETKAAS